ncbi:hypothetical protein CAPI_01455 [Corynebacterium capitovis DSM 44611]|uniref:DUF2786 domain-containing protein n=1 Tax=Corynebacterium capitovis TaxID=131081 RepID=UPI001FE1B864|nr:DUF2786 domain-containing protein [Corynebacterium capitovis]WKD56865.1 hypothetical protein CAPI_01455 [Corynebacterium capitovis DSM 44611]
MQDKVRDKVAKLLNQAADRAGTPEGDAFYDKAFALMAEYGFSERDVSKPDDGDDVVRRTFDFTGSYTDKQAALLFAIAVALHCAGFQCKMPRSTKVVSATVFGLRRHAERVEVLYALLSPGMALGAQRVKHCGYGDASTVVKRRSFMAGFARSVGERLSSAERTVADRDTRYSLALMSDSERADKARDEFASREGFFLGSYRSSCAIDGVSYGDGLEAGRAVDLGQTRMPSRRAISS